ncbi:glycoside hydrolase family 3 C-terminal domain-containing protein [Rhodothermus marinus]|uniref:glycoside hydrolase family 3 C-terminal domain-containing protein n=1 Tax=Rhodothermus marinus TaxID=29549 RepID=UPI0037CB4406
MHVYRHAPALLACLLVLPILQAVAQPLYPFQNPDLPDEVRIDDLLSRMTLEEKIAALGTDPSVPRLGLRLSRHVEGLHGLALGGPGDWGRGHPIPTTQFPQAVGLGQTWDPELIRRVAEAEAIEARYIFHRYGRGGLVIRAPNADLARDIRWGRTEESYGEDPFLTGTLTVAFVRGLQGDHPRYWRAASLLKHFLANSNENDRERSSSNFPARQLHEYYIVPFRMGIVEGGARAFMAAYNAHNGIPMTVHPLLRYTRTAWGHDGIICTDAGAMRLLVEGHHYYPDLPMAAAASLRAGINQFLDRFREPVTQALAEGLLTEADLDVALRPIYRVMLRLGLLDPPERVPYIPDTTQPPPWTQEAHRQLARLVTQKSIVLLKNDGLLPLDTTRIRSIAVVGALADSVLLDWYSGDLPYAITPLQGLREYVGRRIAVHYAPDNADGRAAALARAADIAIVVVGNHPTCNAGWARCPDPAEGKEAVDRHSLTLREEVLIKEIYRANPRTVVVLVSSFPFAIVWTDQHVPAILHVTHSSQELGRALADVLFGDVNPGGKLVHTWPRSLDQLPPIMDYDLRNGRTYMYFRGEPLYPFGYGLSYTTFAFERLQVSADTLHPTDTLQVQVTLTNTGRRTGDEVVQLYVRYPDATVERPRLQLRAFRRVTLQPGETRTVTLSLKGHDLGYWDVFRNTWAFEPGRIELLVGNSSRDLYLRQTIFLKTNHR